MALRKQQVAVVDVVLFSISSLIYTCIIKLQSLNASISLLSWYPMCCVGDAVHEHGDEIQMASINDA